MKKLYVIEPTKYQLVFYLKHNNYLKPLLNTNLIAYSVPHLDILRPGAKKWRPLKGLPIGNIIRDRSSWVHQPIRL